MYILYIDDPENQLSFKALFRRKFPIFTAGGLSEAKELMTRYKFKIVLLNQLTQMQSVYELMEWVKQFDSEIIQIFVFSNVANSGVEPVQHKYKKLAQQCLWKPWNTQEMESVLLKWWN